MFSAFRLCIQRMDCLIVVLAGILAAPSLGFKFNSPSVLLPFNLGLPTNFTLEFDGLKTDDCFEWQSSAPHIVHVYPLYTDYDQSCSQKAVVTAVTTLDERHVTRLTVFHKGKIGVELSCDVITDAVHSIGLSYTTEELFLEGPPQELSVVAKNIQGHTFSSVNGLNFHWMVTKNYDDVATEGKNNIIRLVKYSDSAYKSASDVTAWEQRGMFGSSILVQPQNVGLADVSVTLHHPTFSTVDVAQISISVAPNFKVFPASDVSLLQSATIHPYLQTIKQGKPADLDLANFNVRVGDASVASLKDDYSKLTALEYGSTVLIYEERNSSHAVPLKVQVVKPRYIVLRVSGGNIWTLQEVKSYEVFVDLYDEEKNKIYPSDNIRVHLSFPSKLFHINSTSLNGTHYNVQTVTPGSGVIRGEFKGIINEDGSLIKEHAMSVSQEITVCQKLSIAPSTTLLPAYEYANPLYEIPFKVIGGTGHYMWASSNHTAASIAFDAEHGNSAVLSVHEEGDITVTAVDRNNFNFIATAKVSIQPVNDIEVFPAVVETNVDNILIVPTALLGYECKEKKIFRSFDDCSKIQLSVEIIEKHVLAYEPDADNPAFGRGCQSLQFRCKLPGYSRINLYYQPKTSVNSTLKTTFVLSCYKELKPIHPVRVAVLAIGTSKEVVFEGGPRRWPMLKEGHVTNLKANEPQFVNIELIKDPVRYNRDLTVFRVTCKALGENILTFEIGNKPSATNQHPAKLESSVKIVCSEPHSVHIKLSRKEDKKQSLEDNVVKVPFYGKKVFEVDLWVKDSTGRKFANISSFNVHWDVSDNRLAKPKEYKDFRTYVDGSAGYRKISRDFQDFEMTGETGKLRIQAKIIGYRKDVLAKEEIKTYDELEEVANTVDLKLVSLRDIHAESYYSDQQKDVENSCDGDSCQA